MGSAKLKLILGSIYPVGVMTFAGFLMPVMGQIDFEVGLCWNTAAYLADVAKIQVPLWGAIFIILFLAKVKSPILPVLAKCLPGFRGHRINQSLADFSYALAAFLEAGTPIGKAWAGAGFVSNDPPIVKAANAMRDRIADGATPSEHLDQYRCFPDEFISLYTTGEKTGQLDHNLLVLGQQFQAQANRAMTFATIFYTALMFAGVMLMMVISIVMFYAKYLTGITSLME
ncbi:MAG: type II secretion system F family protein, partial [Puniceicoccales bacterium]